MWQRSITILLAAFFLGVLAGPATAQSDASAIVPKSGPPRVALVIGNAGYGKAPLPTALNDAGLVAEALRSIGFEIVDGADLSQRDMMRLFHDFLAKIKSGGPETIAFIYYSGYALEFEGDNFLVSAEAKLERDSDILTDTVRLADLLRPLAATPARAKLVVLDAARRLPFALKGKPLAAVAAPPGSLVALSAAPGTLALDRADAYGIYAVALAEMLREPGLDLDAIFTRVRARTHQLSAGKQTPWHALALPDPIVLVARSTAPPPALRTLRPRPMRDLGAEEAYALAIELDTLDGYVSFVAAYPRHSYARRIWAMIRARREALAWLRAVQINTPASYWTYLRRYQSGVYALDAGRRLRRLAAANEPPADFAMLDFYDVPPPLADEPDDYYEIFEGGPPPPPSLIAPPPPFFAALPAPNTSRRSPRTLPVPVPIPLIGGIAPPPPPAAAAPAASVAPDAAAAVAPAAANVEENLQSQRAPPGSTWEKRPPRAAIRRGPSRPDTMRRPPPRPSLARPTQSRQAQSRPVVRMVRPVAASKPAKPASAKKCRIVNGRKVCK